MASQCCNKLERLRVGKTHDSAAQHAAADNKLHQLRRKTRERDAASAVLGATQQLLETKHQTRGPRRLLSMPQVAKTRRRSGVFRRRSLLVLLSFAHQPPLLRRLSHSTAAFTISFSPLRTWCLFRIRIRAGARLGARGGCARRSGRHLRSLNPVLVECRVTNENRRPEISVYC
jgi:hypothetical protein